MARCATIASEQTEAAIIAIGAANNACEGRIYPANDADVCYLGLADGTVLGPLPGSGGGSSVDPWETTTITVTDEISVVITYQGDAPTIAKNADGIYEISISADTQVKGYHATSLGSVTFVSSTTIRMRMADADGKSLYSNYTVLQKTTGEKAGELMGVIEKQTVPTAGTIQAEFPNMNGLSGGFIIICTISI